jgi:RNA polymerase sigma factor (sigma-70 family)
MSVILPALFRSTPTDSELVASCLDGDEQAWAQLIERYKRLIYSIPLKHGLSADDAADLFQAVCLDLVAELPRLRDPKALPKWLIQTTTHKVLKWKRRQSRTVADDVSACEAEGPPQEMPDARIEEIEQEQAVRDALEALPPRCREMVDMLFFEVPPRPYIEVAAQLGLAPGSIGFMRNRCLRRLKVELLKAGL